MITPISLLRARQPVLRTGRLVLRPPRSADTEALAQHLSDPDVARMLIHVPLPCGRARAAAWIGGMRAEIRRGRARYYVLQQGPAVAGLAGLTDIGAGRAELGYWLGRKWWGRGLMSEAVTPILCASWRLSGLERIEAVHMADNEASARLLLGAGFRYTGAVKLHSRARGMDVLCRTMRLDREWAEAQTGLATAAPAA
ncbi:MAG: GNAT family N-acetyltransferase [Alphaproteobacteria bacterium]